MEITLGPYPRLKCPTWPVRFQIRHAHSEHLTAAIGCFRARHGEVGFALSPPSSELLQHFATCLESFLQHKTINSSRKASTRNSNPKDIPTKTPPQWSKQSPSSVVIPTSRAPLPLLRRTRVLPRPWNGISLATTPTLSVVCTFTLLVITPMAAPVRGLTSTPTTRNTAHQRTQSATSAISETSRPMVRAMQRALFRTSSSS